MILVTGFGPFLDIRRNPSGDLAQRVDGLRLRGETVLGELLPVSYVRSTATTVALARKHRPRLVLGIGVAAARAEPWVEARGVPVSESTPDIDGDRGLSILRGVSEQHATLDVEGLAAALGCGVSRDAGRYVCNGWLYRVAQDLPDLPVGFLHIPTSGLSPRLLAQGLAALFA